MPDRDRDDDHEHTDPALPAHGRWQVDVVGLPMWLWPQQVTGEPCVVMVVDADEGAVRAVSTGVREALPGLLDDTLQRARHEPPRALPTRWPRVVEVRDDAVADWLSVIDGPWTVETFAQLPVLQAALDALFERLTPPPRFALDGVGPGLLARSADLVEAAPWRHYDESDVLVIEHPGHELEWPVASLVGAAGEVHGIVLHRGLEARLAAGTTTSQEPPGHDSLVLWLFEAIELLPDERARYASLGYGRLDRYPVYSRLEAASSEVRSAHAGERAALERVLEAVLSFVAAWPRPPGTDVVHELDDGRRVRRVIAPSPSQEDDGAEALIDLRELDVLLVDETVLVPAELPRAVLGQLNAALGDGYGLTDAELARLPQVVSVLVVRSRKRPMVPVVERIVSDGLDGLMPVTFDGASGADVGDADDDTAPEASPVALALTRGREPRAILLDVDRAFAELLGAHAQGQGGELLLVLSAGGTRRSSPGTLRSRDVLCLRRLTWIDVLTLVDPGLR